MIVADTSAIMAVCLREVGWSSIEDALFDNRCAIPAPVIVEFTQVATGRRGGKHIPVSEFMAALLSAPKIEITPLGADEATLASSAVTTYGKGRGSRAQLNVVDLMVYGIAKRLRAPILCTGRDFADTDIAIHPASRLS